MFAERSRCFPARHGPRLCFSISPVSIVSLRGSAGFCSLSSKMFSVSSVSSGPVPQRFVSQQSPVSTRFCSVLLIPFAQTSLRASLHPNISISDASEEGGGSAVAGNFVVSKSPHGGQALDVAACQLLAASPDACSSAQAERGRSGIRSFVCPPFSGDRAPF